MRISDWSSDVCSSDLITEYRITPPGASLPEDPFFGRHQDAFYNMGMECFTCWIPLMEIDERIGGLAVIPGLHKGDFFHDRNDPPQYRIPQGALRSEERRVGKECVSTCSSWCAPIH